MRCRYFLAKKSHLILAAFIAVGVFVMLPLSLATAQAERVDERGAESTMAKVAALIFRNECASDLACLTSWNRGEEFASLGIGHFIWYPVGIAEKDKHFQESFPALLRFMAEEGVRLPDWLANAQGSPWASRALFERAQKTQKLSDLREFLIKTMPFQAKFMQKRLGNALPLMLAKTDSIQRGHIQHKHIRRQFERVAAAPMGVYVLTDYVNFKGEGTRSSERYQAQGWGLMQVLAGMRGKGTGLAAIQEFSRVAVAVLQRRVVNSPPYRHEARWLPGWQKRIASYVYEAARLINSEQSSLH